MDMTVLINKLISISLIAAIGYLLSYQRVLTSHNKSSITLLINRLCLPLLLFTSVANIKLTLSSLIEVALIFLIAYICMFGNYLFSNMIIKRNGLSPQQRTVVINGSIHSNVAFFAFPILFALYGEQGIFYGAVYFLADSIFLWTLGIKRFVKTSQKPFSTTKLNVATKALILALFFLAIGSITQINYMDNVVFSTLSELGAMTTYLAFIFIGMMIYETQLSELLKNHVVLTVLLFKLLIWPIVIGVLILASGIHLSDVLFGVILVQISMPPFANLVALSFDHDQDMYYASTMVVIGHIASILTLPLIFYIVDKLSLLL